MQGELQGSRDGKKGGIRCPLSPASSLAKAKNASRPHPHNHDCCGAGVGKAADLRAAKEAVVDTRKFWPEKIRKGSLRLQSMDLKWLSAMEVYGILGLGQMVGMALGRGAPRDGLMRLLFNRTVKKDHWRGRSRRVLRLAQAGYVAPHRFPGRSAVFTLTEKGHEALKQSGLARLPGFRRRISEAMVEHESKVAGVGLVLSEILGLEVLPARERIEWKGRGGRPPTDFKRVADLWIADDHEPRAVEVERGQKVKEEYREKWSNMRLTLPEKGLLLYLTTWPGGKRFILEQAQDFRAEFVLAASLEEFVQALGRCRFVGYQPGKSMILRPHVAAAPPLLLPVRAPTKEPALTGPPSPIPRTSGGMDL